MRHFLDLLDLTRDEITDLFDETARLKAAHLPLDVLGCADLGNLAEACLAEYGDCFIENLFLFFYRA